VEAGTSTFRLPEAPFSGPSSLRRLRRRVWGCPPRIRRPERRWSGRRAGPREPYNQAVHELCFQHRDPGPISSCHRAAKRKLANNADPTLDNRANALARAINKTGVESLNNPCTVVGWYAASTLEAGIGLAGANARTIGTAAARRIPVFVPQVLDVVERACTTRGYRECCNSSCQGRSRPNPEHMFQAPVGSGEPQESAITPDFCDGRGALC
jgi:hypothetical protein